MSMYKLITAAVLFLVSGLVYGETIWIDVRSAQEYEQSYIAGDLHIPYQSIVAGLEKDSIEKDATIKLYCRSGGRAGKAKKSLEAAGYTDVSNAGGIEDVRKKRNLTVD
jgi:phage shock protein E